jgi:hypothetical protein
MSFEFTPNVRDALLANSKALPAAGATAVSDAINLGQEVGGRLKDVILEVSVPALAAHTDAAESVVFTLQDSADGETFADVDPSITTTIIGVASTGSAAKVVRFRLPLNVRQYVAIEAAVSDVDTGPVLTASEYDVALVLC